MNSLAFVPFALAVLNVELTAPGLVIAAAPVHASGFVGLDLVSVIDSATEEVPGSPCRFFLSSTVSAGLPGAEVALGPG